MSIPAPRPALLFDLDGTLTDPFVGITRFIQYAMEKLGRLVPAADDLRWCIGPPLKSAFRTLLDTDDDTATDAAVRLYRERYSVVGKFENSLIQGIPEMLATLAGEGYFLSIATSKLKTYAGDIIDHFELRRYFHVLHGSELDGRNAAKGDLVRHILATEQIDATSTVMIGDRSHDVVGASANGVAAIGVLWGYGDRSELEGAGAARIANRPEELPHLVRAVLGPA
ncbi:HAD hydrolase-like protein [Mesorhizobium sp. BAC0120]|uniref:HAD hydrolase-like protein n=1 Tax=Mesorhizobium sp. BAC0120 TaxID=3090670 RepID=UPI00298CF756|nr:HAD hydrolase-like protein [Mesorhizobium sp. BAC0120]MDW6022753.1 HAD hydrolase-like protein [Mesorhizobium sp. BAC0120]